MESVIVSVPSLLHFVSSEGEEKSLSSVANPPNLIERCECEDIKEERAGRAGIEEL